MVLHLEPQGILFAEIKFVNPSIQPRKPKLKRQKVFERQRGQSILPEMIKKADGQTDKTATNVWTANNYRKPFDWKALLPTAGKNITRPVQIGIDVATWGRLLRHNLPTSQNADQGIPINNAANASHKSITNNSSGILDNNEESIGEWVS